MQKLLVTFGILFLFCALSLPIQSFGQKLYQLVGEVVDNSTSEPLPYVTVALVSKTTGKIIGGTTTDEEGKFELMNADNQVQVEFSFMGFDKFIVENLPKTTERVDLGKISLHAQAVNLGEVEVVAERSTMEFKLDKRVFHVGKDIASTGAGALEVLNNVPSVNVDIEGNVTLRGNKGVQILIDGKPSALSDDPRKALGTITADMIENVEVITNPSAKYQAGGTSGIINIVMKKEEKKGVNGSISLNTGYPQNHSIGGSLNYRTQKFNFFTQFGGGYRSMPNINESTNQNRFNLSRVDSEGKSFRNEQFYNITLGADYFLNKYNTLTLSGNFAYELENNPSETTFEIHDTTGQLASQYARTEETTATNPKWQYDLQYKKQFKNNKDHTLVISTLGRFFGKDQSSEFLNTYSLGNTGAIDQRTETDFYQSDFTYKLDYTNPITKELSFELGSMYEINDVGNNYAVFNYENDTWAPNINLTNDFRYNQKVLGVYGTGSYEGNRWGVKLGLRAENTDLSTLLQNTDAQNNQNYTNLFPSVHTSYKITERLSLQAGYSRRILRPRLWDLNPFFNIQNNYNIRTGNPNLKPEFADSYEITSIWVQNKWSLNASAYHLYTTDVMENVSYYQNNINVMTRENVGTNRKTGIELNGKYNPTKWFGLIGDFNYGFFNRQGEFNNASFDFKGAQWSSKLTLKLKFPKDIDLELTPSYQSSFKTVQGSTQGYFSADAGLRKKLLKNRAVLSLGIRDIFASRIMETIVDQPDYYLRTFSKRGRFTTLGFSYSFGKGEVMTYGGGGGGGGRR